MFVYHIEKMIIGLPPIFTIIFLPYQPLRLHFDANLTTKIIYDILSWIEIFDKSVDLSIELFHFADKLFVFC